MSSFVSRRRFLRAASASPAAPGLIGAPPARPNILFFFPDQQRCDWTGLNRGLALRTPNLNALARRGVAFSRAQVASPLCAPSRACLAAGKEYDRCGVANNGSDYPLDQPTFYALLRGGGYHVAGCGKFDLHKATLDWGLDGKRLLAEWGFSDGIDNAGKWDAIRSGAESPKDPYMASLHRQELAGVHVADFRNRSGANQYRNTAPTPLPEGAYCDNWVARNGLELLGRAPRNRPWFLMVNFTGPHSPMDITARMDRLCRDRGFPQPVNSSEFTAEIHVAIRQNYSAMVENIDRWLGLYLDELTKRRELDRTVVVWSSDHGEMLGDHNRWGKSVPYQPSAGVPLVFGGPGIESGLVSDALVSHIDLTATFLEFAGLKVPADMDSRSLRPLLEGRARSHRDYVLSGLNAWRSVRDNRYKLVRGFGTPPILLFDLEQDPRETRNIAAEKPAEVERLWKLLSFRSGAG
jgi:arylsulfatase